MTTVTGYFTNNDPALDPPAVAALIGQEPVLTMDLGARTARKRTRITEATSTDGVVNVTVDVPDADPGLGRSLASAENDASLGIRSVERDGARVEAVDLWTAGEGRPWAERVMRHRHRGAYATAVIDATDLADAHRRRVVVDRTKAEAERHWDASFGDEPHDRYRLKIEALDAAPGTYEVNVALLPVGATL